MLVEVGFLAELVGRPPAHWALLKYLHVAFLVNFLDYFKAHRVTLQSLEVLGLSQELPTKHVLIGRKLIYRREPGAQGSVRQLCGPITSGIDGSSGDGDVGGDGRFRQSLLEHLG